MGGSLLSCGQVEKGRKRLESILQSGSPLTANGGEKRKTLGLTLSSTLDRSLDLSMVAGVRSKAGIINRMKYDDNSATFTLSQCPTPYRPILRQDCYRPQFLPPQYITMILPGRRQSSRLQAYSVPPSHRPPLLAPTHRPLTAMPNQFQWPLPVDRGPSWSILFLKSIASFALAYPP